MNKKLATLASLSLIFIMPTADASNSVLVFAASSLTESYTQIGKNFEKSHPGVKIVFSFQASSTLATQIKAGAPADIFVSAEPFNGGTNYLVNQVVLAVPKSSQITKFADLNGKVTWIQCAHEVPCGSATDAALINEDVKSKPVSLEPKVSSALSKLLAGEVDAAFVYRTDVIANNKKLNAIEFANKQAASTTYQIAQLRKNRWAKTFMNYLQSKSVLRILQNKGFEIK